MKKNDKEHLEGYWTSLKAFSLGKSLSTGNSKSFFVQQNNKKHYNN